MTESMNVQINHNVIGRQYAAKAKESTGVNVSFIEYDGKRYHFSSQWHRCYKQIGIDGKVERESQVTKNWIGSGEYVYYTTACYPQQLTNGDLEFMIEHKMSQDIHERWEN